jgi:O-Antigen ligase
MTAAALGLATLLIFGTLTLWVEARWAWSLFQLGVFVLVGWRVAAGHWKRLPTAPFWPLAAACVCAFLQVLFKWSVEPARTASAALDWFTFVAVFALAVDIFSTQPARRWFLRAAVLFGMLLAAEATIQNYASGGKIFWFFASGYTDGVMGPFVNRGQYSAWVELLLPVALYLAFSDPLRRVLWGSAAAVLFGSLVAGASRAGFALASAELLGVVLVAAARKFIGWRKLVVAAVQIVVLAGIATTVAGWQGLATRLEMGGGESLRADALRASLSMVRAHPWTGSGLGTWPTLYPAYATVDTGLFMNQAHNDWAQWAAEGGLPFALLLVVFWLLCCRRAIPSIYGLGVVAFLLHAVVDYPMQQRPVLAAWFFVMAGAAAVWRSDRG